MSCKNDFYTEMLTFYRYKSTCAKPNSVVFTLVCPEFGYVLLLGFDFSLPHVFLIIIIGFESLLKHLQIQNPSLVF